MTRRRKKVVHFVLPVLFEYKDDAALRGAIRAFLKDTTWGCMAGDWGWQQKRPRLLKKEAKP